MTNTQSGIRYLINTNGIRRKIRGKVVGLIVLILLSIQPSSVTMAQSEETIAFVNVNVIPHGYRTGC